MMNATKMKVCRGPWNAARILAALLFAACLLIGIALADPPQYLPLQGQLTDQNGRIIQSGSETYTYKVVLYDSPDSVNALWQDTFANQTIINGVFNVMLGSQIPLTQALFDKLGANGVLYVGITITGRNGIGVPGGGVEMRPRLTLVSVPFSLQANKAKTADTATNATNADKAAFASNAGQLQGSAIDDILARVKIPELNVGTILETYGGAAEQAIDPRTLDLDGDGKTTAPLSIAKTLKGIDVPTSMTKWMVCVQNANKNLRFPNTAEIDSSLRNALIPEKALTMGRVSNETYVWRNLIPATGGFTSTSALGAGMAYDPVLDAYWLTEGQGDHRKLSLIYRDASDATKVYIRSISLPSEAPSLNDQKKLDVVGRILVFGPSTSSQAGYDTPGFTLRIGGTDPTNATLTYISAATIGTADTPNRNPGGYFFNQNTSDFHYFNGTYLNNVSYWPQTHNIYHLTGENLGFLKSISSNGTNVFRQEYQDITTYDSVNNIGYKYGGYFYHTGVGAMRVNSELYLYDGVQEKWFFLLPPGGPGALAGAVACVHPLKRTFIIWGGFTTQTFTLASQGLWEYDKNTNSWTVLNQINPPTVRYGAACCYDSKRQSLIVYGGEDASSYRTDLWEMQFGGEAKTDAYIIKIK